MSQPNSSPEHHKVVIVGGGKVPGLTEALGQRGVSSNYRFDLAPRTWEYIRDLRGGTALFTMPAGSVKCAGAPQKIAYLAADWWRTQGVLDRTRIILVLPTAAMFSQPDWAKVLEGAPRATASRSARSPSSWRWTGPVTGRSSLTRRRARRRPSPTTSCTPPRRRAPRTGSRPLRWPTWPARSATCGWTSTRCSPDWPNVFALGDVSSLPTSKTGAAIRAQAPVLTANLLATMRGQVLSGHYNGYTSCPLVTSRNRMLLAEFDYDLKRTPTIPFINTLKPATTCGCSSATVCPACTGMSWSRASPDLPAG